jgi:glycosyltransferase involved in cell wall biosynthesis
MKKKILFVSHEASRTGAPIVLLHLLRWLKANTSLEFVILVKWPGELLSEFEAVGPTYTFQFPYPSLKGFKSKLVGNWNTYIGIPQYYSKLKKELVAHNIGLIYANGIGTGVLLNFLEFLHCKVICHIHELEIGIQANGKENLAYIKKCTSHYIAVSKAVKHNLMRNHFIEESLISLVYEFIPQREIVSDRKLLTEYHIPDKAFVVGAAGSADIRKGADLFVLLAKELIDISTKELFYFVWIGNKSASNEYIFEDIKKLGLEKQVIFTGSKSDPLPYFIDFDAFVLLSREDPYPLVCLENALLSKPILCFDNSGGMPEFVGNDCGFVVPYLDIKVMAARIRDLQANMELKVQLGENAREKAVLQHDVHVTAPQILELIHKFLPLG